MSVRAQQPVPKPASTNTKVSAATSSSTTQSPTPPRKENAVGSEDDDKKTADLFIRRYNWFNHPRASVNGRIPGGAYQRGFQHLQQMLLAEGKLTRLADGSFAEVSAPLQFSQSAVTSAWTSLGPAPATGGDFSPVTGRVMTIAVDPNDTTGNTVLLGGAMGGIWRSTNAGATWTAVGDQNASLAMGAIAFAPSSPATVYAGTGELSLGFDTYYDIPVVSISAEDQDLLQRFLDRGKSVRIHIDVQNRVTAGPANTANVVGDIPGTEHPEQVIVVVGHLDSWDLSEGSTDDGVGVVTTLGAAEAIARSGFKPRRTIRFVLFTGEEEGLLGSLAYVKTHKNDMKNHVAAVILDNGQGPVTALNMGGRDDTLSAVDPFVATLQAFGKITANDTTEFGTDAGPFILAGLPGINLDQDSPEYRYTHHSPVDTFDKVDEAILTRDATVQGLVAFWIAARPDRLASPWPPEKSAEMLTRTHDDVFLKLFGLWPFGNSPQQ